MGIAPVQNLLPMQVKLPEAAVPETERTRAVEFRGQEQDATYTPGGGSEDTGPEDSGRDGSGRKAPSQDERSVDAEAVEANADSLPPKASGSTALISSDDSPAEGTISVFA